MAAGRPSDTRVVLTVDVANEEDLLSIGTIDRMRYTLVIDRENPRMAPASDPCHPATLRMAPRAGAVPSSRCGASGERLGSGGPASSFRLRRGRLRSRLRAEEVVYPGVVRDAVENEAWWSRSGSNRRPPECHSQSAGRRRFTPVRPGRQRSIVSNSPRGERTGERVGEQASAVRTSITSDLSERGIGDVAPAKSARMSAQAPFTFRKEGQPLSVAGLQRGRPQRGTASPACPEARPAQTVEDQRHRGDPGARTQTRAGVVPRNA